MAPASWHLLKAFSGYNVEVRHLQNKATPSGQSAVRASSHAVVILVVEFLLRPDLSFSLCWVEVNLRQDFLHKQLLGLSARSCLFTMGAEE